MLENLNLEKVLVLDVETVSQYPALEDMPENWQKLWEKKALHLARNNESPEELYPRAAIYAEFGKVVCISVGIFLKKPEGYHFRIKSFYGEDETEILMNFSDMLNKHFSQFSLCAHNGKEFDFPYLSRRMLANGLKLPQSLDLAGKKPWEIPHLDTLDLWKFGDYKNYTSLELLAAVFGIPTPKDDIDGSMVGNVYWNEKDIERIRTYCQKDIITLARLLLKFKGEGILADENIIYSN